MCTTTWKPPDFGSSFCVLVIAIGLCWVYIFAVSGTLLHRDGYNRGKFDVRKSSRQRAPIVQLLEDES